ncbi:MAG TPA: hypothetical protein VKB69_02860 [Micromonosporaceae bacterium]|nr:hypothetical protein [Micromonosporaceae bacterium]
MSRIVAAVVVAVGATLATPVPARAADTTATTTCTITDDRVNGLSGLVATADGFVGVSDSNFDASKVRIWFLDAQCHVQRSVRYPTRARDPEDLAMGRDGTLYVADIGDNDRNRPSIAVWRLRPGQTTPKIFRYAYPDGAHDAEAMLLAADDTPVFVTKDPITAGLYVPTGPADPSGTPVPLKKVGTFTLTPTDTDSGVGELGGFVVTGGAQPADRGRAVLRSYNDAYEWDVTGGDVVAAITTAKPRITPLPDEPQGESIAYTPDGTGYYTVSDEETEPVRTKILRYPAPSGPPAATGSPTPATASTAAAARPGGSAPGYQVGLLVGVIAVGVVLVGFAMVASIRMTRRPGGPTGQ